ncbi:MAG: hypothetical protein ACRD4B_00635 [Acidobacteriota bacterium]
MAEETWLDKMMADRDKHTPKTGYNLVGIDDFEEPGKQLYLIGHFDTYDWALEAQKKYKGDSVIYEPDN